MRAGIQEDALRAMLEGGAVREVLVSRHGEQGVDRENGQNRTLSMRPARLKP